MAEVFPTFENIQRLKVAPTDGELSILKYLAEQLSDDYEVYYQPYFNGEFPDVVVMRRGAGVIIIEVKDWNLSSYKVDNKNNWCERNGNHTIRSPFQQVFGYKSNMFNLHINGLAERKVKNKNFYNIIKPFVYFHEATKTDIEKIFSAPIQAIKDQRDELNDKYSKKKIDFPSYEKQMDYLDKKSKQFNRDRGLTVYKANLRKLIDILRSHPLFNDDIYTAFRRYLRPPYHVEKQGVDIKYDKKQASLIKSEPVFQKIKGVAGSGKTTVLAKRAVNAHLRHEGKVLILTFNKTLRNFIHDKISDVRESFSWGAFCIINYHSFLNQTLNACGIKIEPPEPDENHSQYFERKYYSNERIFEAFQEEIYKYQTILIDEIQDYRPEWIKIIRKYFLAEDGEMVLFGDEGQNIYERSINKTNSAIVQGFGRWERLTKSYRSEMGSPLTNMFSSFQTNFLAEKYDIDIVETEQTALSLDILNGFSFVDEKDAVVISDYIIKFIKNNETHPNDICIVSTNIPFLRKLDQIIRETTGEKTETTFESEEVFQDICQSGVSADAQKKELESLRGSKKFSFHSNSGLLKLSTVHSFKGLEAHTAIYILDKNDNPEMAYTGITRAKRNLIMFIQEESKFMNYFGGQLSLAPIICEENAKDIVF